MAARKPSERAHGGESEVADLNLVPIMAIMVILVPMLIYMFNFNQIRVQRVTAPRRGTGSKKAADESKEKELNLTVLIRKDKGFQVTWEEALMPDQQTTPLIPMQQSDDSDCGNPEDPKADRTPGCFPRPEGCFCYDTAALYTELVAKKRKFSQPDKPEKRVNVSADEEISWEVVSAVIDAASCIRADPDSPDSAVESFTDLKSYRSAPPKKGEAVSVPGVDEPVQLCEELFPQVVFAMIE